MANISRVTLLDGNTYDIKDANAQEKILTNGVLKGDGEGGVSAATAEDVPYDNTDSSLASNNVQAAIDEVVSDLETKQDTLTFDTAPTANSTNPVQSGGVYTDVRTRVPNYGKGKDLLRNSYFIGGGTGRGVFPVNQRGKTSYSGDTSIFDGWTADTNTSITFGSAGITVSLLSGSSTNIYQRVGKAPLGQSITMSILTGNGLVSVSGVMPSTLPSSNQTVLTVGTSADGYRFRLYLQPAGTMYAEFRAYAAQTWVAAKLELGSEQTLAHQENGTWVLNEIPDYEYELYRCITSTADPADIYANKIITTNVSKPNLLRNWYFVGEGTGRGVLPVNQRGATTLNVGSKYFIDGWVTRNTTGSVSLSSSGLSVTTPSGLGARFALFQYINLSDYVGQSLTLSVLNSDNLYSASVESLSITGTNTRAIAVSMDDGGLAELYVSTSGCYISLSSGIGNTSTFKAVKLEPGIDQTLCHRENNTWVSNEIPDYEEELIKCQTSTADSADTFSGKSLATEQQIAYVENGTTTSRAYAVGEYFCWNGLLYRVTTAISSGGTITPTSNCTQVTEGGFNALLPSITNGTLDTTKVSGYAQAISAGSLRMVFFKLTTSVAVGTSDTLVSFPSGNAPSVRQQPLQFLFKRPADTAPTIREDRAGVYLNTSGTITQSLSNALTVGTLLQGFFIWIE